METKSGVKTTEFWGTQVLNLLLIVLAIAASQGVIGADDQAKVNEAVTQIVAAIGAVINNAIYVWGRVQAKQAGTTTTAPPSDGPVL